MATTHDHHGVIVTSIERPQAELVAICRALYTGPKTPETITPIADRYGLEMRFETIPDLVAEHRLRWPGVGEEQS